MIVGVQPADGQVDVPIDVIPRVFTEVSENGGDDFYSPYLRLLLGEEEIESSQRDLIGSPETTELSPNADLEPETTYTFLIEGSEDGNGPVTRAVTFTTGTQKATPIAKPPAFEILSAEFDPSELSRFDDKVNHSVRFRFTPATPDPDKLSIVRVINGDFVFGVFILGGEPIESTVPFFEEPGGEICLSAVQVNATGEQARSERVCATSEMGGSGCNAAASTRGEPLSLAGIALAVSLLVRRRRVSAQTLRPRRKACARFRGHYWRRSTMPIMPPSA